VALNTDVELSPIGGSPLTLGEQTQLFHLVAVVIDPYTEQSAWLLRTAGRILSELKEADCRVAWIVTAVEQDARTFLGPWASEYLTFCDPERKVVEALGVEEIPALVVVGTNQELVGKADGWDPARGLRRFAGRGLSPPAAQRASHPPSTASTWPVT
jgi:hypothetical protein